MNTVTGSWKRKWEYCLTTDRFKHHTHSAFSPSSRCLAQVRPLLSWRSCSKRRWAFHDIDMPHVDRKWLVPPSQHQDTTYLIGSPSPGKLCFWTGSRHWGMTDGAQDVFKSELNFKPNLYSVNTWRKTEGNTHTPDVLFTFVADHESLGGWHHARTVEETLAKVEFGEGEFKARGYSAACNGTGECWPMFYLRWYRRQWGLSL